MTRLKINRLFIFCAKFNLAHLQKGDKNMAEKEPNPHEEELEVIDSNAEKMLDNVNESIKQLVNYLNKKYVDVELGKERERLEKILEEAEKELNEIMKKYEKIWIERN